MIAETLTLTGPDDSEGLNTIKNVCEDIIQNCLYDDLGYTDISYIKPLHWNYILLQIADRLFKKNKQLLKVNNSINNQYDKDKVICIYNIYKELSNKYGQEIGFIRFTYFSDIDTQTLYNWAKLGGFALVQTIREDSEQSLSAMLGDKSVNALGTIAKLNHYHGWREDSQKTQNINITLSDSPEALRDRYRAKLPDKKQLEFSDNSAE